MRYFQHIKNLSWKPKQMEQKFVTAAVNIPGGGCRPCLLSRHSSTERGRSSLPCHRCLLANTHSPPSCNPGVWAFLSEDGEIWNPGESDLQLGQPILCEDVAGWAVLTTKQCRPLTQQIHLRHSEQGTHPKNWMGKHRVCVLPFTKPGNCLRSYPAWFPLPFISGATLHLAVLPDRDHTWRLEQMSIQNCSILLPYW